MAFKRHKKRGVFIFLLSIFVGIFLFCLWSIEPLLHAEPMRSSTKILDRSGGLLYELNIPDKGGRTLVPYSDLPKAYVQALIASEDRRFYDHRGVDVLAILRVAKETLQHGRLTSGGSTLEQQTVKNIFFPGAKRNALEKIREMVAGAYWAFTHTKEQTIEAYANGISFGNNAFGIASAAQTYFHKDVKSLTLSESAMLAGITQAPSQDDPIRHLSAARQRMNQVLGRMIAEGFISTEQIASGESVRVFAPQHPMIAPHFVFHVLDELSQTYPDIESGGYVVKTTLDPEWQSAAEASVERRLFDLQKQRVTDAAVLIMDSETGEILGYVGSAGYFYDSIQGKVDMVEAKRQPGSALKPFMYFDAFLHGFTPATVIADLPVRFETASGQPYYPRNYSGSYHGPVSIRDALGSSLNIPAVKVLNQIGVPEFMGTLDHFGMHFPESPDYYGLSLVLGGGEVSLYDATRAYAELGQDARSVDPIDVLEVTDVHGNVLEKANPQHQTNLFDDPRANAAAWLVDNILTDPLARGRSFGEGNLLDLGQPVAAKTGTTRDFRDNWAFGTTSKVALGVWVGNADNTPMLGVSGISGAVPIWNDVMRKILERSDRITWPQPDGIIQRDICTVSGTLANSICPKTRGEYFLDGTQPTQQDDWFVEKTIDARTGLLADPSCPGKTLKKIFLEPPAEYSAWISAAGYEFEPIRDCTGKIVSASSTALQIISPIDGDIFEQEDLLDGSSFTIPFMAGGHADLYQWKLNGQAIETKNAVYLWKPHSGSYVLGLEGAGEIRFVVK